MQPQPKVNQRELSPNLAENIEDLKLGFNSLCNELHSIKSQLLEVEEAVSVVKSNLEFTQHSLEMEIASLKMYAKVVSKIESQMTYRRIS